MIGFIVDTLLVNDKQKILIIYLTIVHTQRQTDS